jgi:hypothetical protein
VEVNTNEEEEDVTYFRFRAAMELSFANKIGRLSVSMGV